MNEWWLVGVLLCFFILALLLVLYPLRHSTVAMLLCTLIFSVFVVLCYSQWGAWPEWHYHLKQVVKRQQVDLMLKSVHGPDELIDKLKARLLEQPNSARGWFLLGRLYASERRWQEAHDVYARALTLRPNDEKININDVQSLWELNHRVFDARIRERLHTLLLKNANQPDALSMLAMDAYLRHDYPKAIEAWQHLLTLGILAPEDEQAIRKAIADALQK